MLRISFDSPVFDRNDPADRFDLLLGVNATIDFSIDGKPLFREERFSIVELREALGRWTSDGAQNDFEFESLESDESPFIWFRKEGHLGWRVGSVLLGLPDSGLVSTEDLRHASDEFVSAVDRWVLSRLGVVVLDALGD